MRQLTLLARRRFSPLFAAQSLGVFDDILFRNALVLAVVLRGSTFAGLSTERVVALVAALYVLPYLALSGWAGQLGDKHSKSRLLKTLKLAELVTMGLATFGFWYQSLPVLLVSLFLMSAQSALFEPVKFSMLPELVGGRELTGANALMHAGAFLAVFLGTVAATYLSDGHLSAVGAIATLVSALGFVSSLFVPPTPAADPNLRVARDPLTPIGDLVRAARSHRTVQLSILAVSWFWFMGASFVALLPSFGREVLGGSESIVALFLGVYCGGVAVGALLCERLGGKKLELGLVPIGSIGLTLAAIDLFFASASLQHIGGRLIGIDAFLDSAGSTRMLVDFLLLAVSSGFFIVPLYTFLESRSDPRIRARVMAANSLMNAIFMVASSALLSALPGLGVSIPQTFLILAILSALVSAYIYTVIPEFLLRFIAWILAKLMYRVRVVGDDELPDEGAALLASNHVTYVDWLIIYSVYQRPLRFVMHQQFLRLPLVGWAFRDAKVIPIASAKEDPEAVHRALDRVAEELEDGNVVCIFPEGELTWDGKLGTLKPGIERIVKRTPVPVFPIRLGGLWGSFFSRKDNQAFKRPFRRVWSRITLTTHPPIPPEGFDVEQLEALLGP